MLFIWKIHWGSIGRDLHFHPHSYHFYCWFVRTHIWVHHMLTSTYHAPSVMTDTRSKTVCTYFSISRTHRSGIFWGVIASENISAIFSANSRCWSSRQIQFWGYWRSPTCAYWAQLQESSRVRIWIFRVLPWAIVSIFPDNALYWIVDSRTRWHYTSP